MKLKIAKNRGGATLLARIDGYFVRFDGSVFSCFNAGRLNRKGFTLAEMLVVMLILTIVLAAFAPLMTKRRTVDLTSPWRYAANNSDAYYGLSNTQTAMIGQNAKATNEKDSRLIINTSSANQSHILFKQSGNLKGHLRLTTDSLMLGAYNTSSSASSSNNMTIGIDAFGSNSGMYNTVLGNQSLRYGSGSNYNTTVGYGAGYGGGSYNSLLGYNAGLNGGSYNTAIGAKALDNSGVDVQNNTALGFQSMYGVTGSNNLAIGVDALISATGSNNIAIGNYSNTSSDDNIIIGNDINTDGKSNIIISNEMTKNIEGSNKVFIGKESRNDLNGLGDFFDKYNSSPMIMLGGKYTKVIIPGDLLVMGNIWFHARPYSSFQRFEAARLTWDGLETVAANKKMCPVWYENCVNDTTWESVKEWYDFYEDYYVPSDKRLKNIKKESDYGIDELKNIKVYNFTFKNDKNKEPHVGVIAQDLQKVFPESVKADDNGYLMIRKDEMFYAMVNAVKQLDKLVQGLVGEVKTILFKLNSHDKEIKKLQQENEELKARIEKLEKLVK